MKNHYNVFIFTLLVFTLFTLTIPSAFADVIVINDQESCEYIGGTWDDTVTKICTVSSFTSDDNDVLINGGIRLITTALLENTEDGSITINTNSILEIQSNFNNYGYVESRGTIINIASSDIFNFGAIENHGTLTNDGDIFNGDLTNGAEIINFDTIENNGLIHNYREITNYNIINNPGIINNECGALYTGNIPTVNVVVELCTTDSDGDGLHDDDEINIHGTNPNNSDSDGDGLTDGEEVLTHLTDPNNDDSDSDGLTDYDEVITHLTNPLNSDTDSDGLTDGQEVLTYFTNPNNPDSDSDGLTDGQEVQLGTNPNNALGDLDGDGLTDSQEVLTHFTDPNNSDSDADGLTDYDEVITHLTDPNNSDSDSDELTDNIEINNYLTDPNNPDSDGDGLTDGQEVQLGTNPSSSDSDNDLVNDLIDNCPITANPDQLDSNNDGIGDACQATTEAELKGKFVGKHKNDAFSIFGNFKLDGDKHKRVTGSGTFQITETGDKCEPLTASGQLDFSNEDILDFVLNGEVCHTKHLDKFTGIIDVTGGTGKFAGSTGTGDTSLVIGKKHFGGKTELILNLIQ